MTLINVKGLHRSLKASHVCADSPSLKLGELSGVPVLYFIPLAEGLQGCVSSWIYNLSTPHLVLEPCRLPGRHKELLWGHSTEGAALLSEGHTQN